MCVLFTDLFQLYVLSIESMKLATLIEGMWVLNQIQLNAYFGILVKEHSGDIGKSFILVPKKCMKNATSWFQSVLFPHAKPEFYVFQAFFR